MERNEINVVHNNMAINDEKGPLGASNSFLGNSAVLMRPTFDSIPAWAREGLTPDQLREFVSEYWRACDRYNEAHLAELRLASGGDSELTSNASLESCEPPSSVSAGSSASSGKARRRARYRAAKAARAGKALSAVSYGVVTSREVIQGFCYVAMIREERRDSVVKLIGPRATFVQLLDLEMAAIVPDRSSLFVSRVSAGLFHLGRVGVPLDVCLASVVAKAKLGRAAYEQGSVGAFFQTEVRLARSVDKAPDVCDELGAGSDGFDSVRELRDRARRESLSRVPDGVPTVVVTGSSIGQRDMARFLQSFGSGYSYLALVLPAQVDMAKRMLGPWPTVLDLVTSPVSWFDGYMVMDLVLVPTVGGWRLAEAPVSICFRDQIGTVAARLSGEDLESWGEESLGARLMRDRGFAGVVPRATQRIVD